MMRTFSRRSTLMGKATPDHLFNRSPYRRPAAPALRRPSWFAWLERCSYAFADKQRLLLADDGHPRDPAALYRRDRSSAFAWVTPSLKRMFISLWRSWSARMSTLCLSSGELLRHLITVE